MSNHSLSVLAMGSVFMFAATAWAADAVPENPAAPTTNPGTSPSANPMPKAQPSSKPDTAPDVSASSCSCASSVAANPLEACGHKGLYLRLALGRGSLSTTRSHETDSEAYSGTSMVGSLAVGYSVTSHLVVYLEFLGHRVSNPSQDGTANGPANRVVGSNLDLYGFGLGMAYYLRPANVYFSGTLLSPGVALHGGPNSNYPRDLSSGTAVSLMVGKEWWVAPGLGMGLAGQFVAGSGDPKDTGSDWQTRAFALVLSTTYN